MLNNHIKIYTFIALIPRIEQNAVGDSSIYTSYEIFLYENFTFLKIDFLENVFLNFFSETIKIFFNFIILEKWIFKNVKKMIIILIS